MRDLKGRRDARKMSLIRRRAFRRTAPNPRTCRSTATVRATAHPTVSIREPRLTDRAHVSFGSLANIAVRPRHVRFTPRKRTFVKAIVMSALCQKRISAAHQVMSALGNSGHRGKCHSPQGQVDIAHHPDCHSRNESRTNEHSRYYGRAKQNYSQRIRNSIQCPSYHADETTEHPIERIQEEQEH